MSCKADLLGLSWWTWNCERYARFARERRLKAVTSERSFYSVVWRRRSGYIFLAYAVKSRSVCVGVLLLYYPTHGTVFFASSAADLGHLISAEVNTSYDWCRWEEAPCWKFGSNTRTVSYARDTIKNQVEEITVHIVVWHYIFQVINKHLFNCPTCHSALIRSSCHELVT